MKKRKKKKKQVKYRAVLYCRVGTPEQLSPADIKKEHLIVQKDKKSIDKLTNLFPNLDSSKHL